jgi:hypothetical protein
VRFTLIYDGTLITKARAPEKERVRQVLRPQLCDLWRYPPLPESNFGRVGHTNGLFIERHGMTYLPLVTRQLKTLAHLDVLLLRPQPRGSVIQRRGDIDNQLKVLLDALSIPSTPPIEPASDLPEDVMHVLLEDDDRVGKLTVETDRLLDRSDPERAVAIIRVTLASDEPTYGNQLLVG